MKNQKGLVQILLIVGIVAALAVIGFVIYTQNKKASLGGTYNMSTAPSGEAIAPIQSPKDLNSASANLDSTDTTQLDAQLNALDTASAGF